MELSRSKLWHNTNSASLWAMVSKAHELAFFVRPFDGIATRPITCSSKSNPFMNALAKDHSIEGMMCLLMSCCGHNMLLLGFKRST
jgi:hypothetical protein